MPKKRKPSALRRWAEKDGRGYPDWAIRYVPVVKTLRPWLAKPGFVIEIGANANGLGRFTRRPVIAVDLSMEHLRECRASQRVAAVVRADMMALPFADASAIACVCMDSFEHTSRAGRDAACEEMMRILRPDGAAAIGFPAGTAAFEAEARIRAAYYRYTGGVIRWFEEHVSNGLPTGVRIYAHLREVAGEGRRVLRTGNANIWLWEWMWLVLMCGWPGRGNNLAQAVLRALTPLLARCHFGPCYRTMLWVFPRKPGG